MAHKAVICALRQSGNESPGKAHDRWAERTQ